ncbi:MAG: DUF2270 domain-containing protein [Planctomycetota bacterium]
MAENDKDGPEGQDVLDLESTPLTRPEYIAAIVHLYRGELYRANAWRIRLDHTTNWAVLTTAGLLSFSFGQGKHSHWILLIGMALVTVFLVFEARRFRLADVWRARVRKIEENFYGPILRRDLQSPTANWGKLVADDLFRPKYKITMLMAVRVRFLRNYWPVYLVLVFAWVMHVLGIPDQASTWDSVREHLQTGLLPWWAPLAYLGTLVVLVVLLFVMTPGMPKSEMEHWQSPPDDPGEEPILDV